MGEQIPSVGRIVHYVSSSGAHRPAIIFDALEYTGDDTVSLYIFQHHGEGGSGQVLNVKRDEGYKDHGTWHWPEYIPAK